METDEKFLTGKRVLIIEEDEALSQRFEDICRDLWGASVADAVFDMESAIAKLLSDPSYDLAIVEIVLARNLQDGLRARNLEKERETCIEKIQSLEDANDNSAEFQIQF